MTTHQHYDIQSPRFDEEHENTEQFIVSSVAEYMLEFTSK